MRIGVDLDNTLADYGGVFRRLAVESGVAPPDLDGSRLALRAHVRARPDGERDWVRLQGRVYGSHAHEARVVAGALAFLRRCVDDAVPVHVVSHKSERAKHGDSSVNLREVAMRWLHDNRFFDRDGAGLDPAEVHFEPDRRSKVARIRALGCTHFIDDLPAIFEHTDFPPSVRRFLIDASDEAGEGPYERVSGFSEVTRALFAE